MPQSLACRSVHFKTRTDVPMCVICARTVKTLSLGSELHTGHLDVATTCTCSFTHGCHACNIIRHPHSTQR
jgi:hypothetical protein